MVSDETILSRLSKERKELQESGDLPEWFTTQGWQAYCSGYKLPEEKGYKQRVATIAKTLSRHTDSPKEWEDKFYNILWKGWLACSTPVLANIGTDRGCAVSCSGGYVDDNVYSFYESQKEVAILSQNGFGTSSYLGDIRPRGSKISRGGYASGVLPVLKGFVNVAKDISQGSSRRGAWAGYISIEHEDFWEVVEYLKNNPDDTNIGFNIHDSFIERLENKDPDALARFKRALKVKCITGKGYFYFVDKVERMQPPMYSELGLKSKASNLCVAPETPILTDKGYKPIQDLEGEKVNVWNGEEWSEVEVVKTGENQNLVTVNTDSGFSIDCTPYHKFYVVDNYKDAPREVRASGLNVGDKLIKFDLPVIEGTKSLDKAYANGFFSGDGCEYGGKKIIYLYGEKKKLLGKLDVESPLTFNEDRATLSNVKGLREKYFVPDAEYTIKSRVEWLSGYLDADGSVSRNGKNESLQVASIDKNFLKKVQFLLQTLGVNSKLSLFREEGNNLLPKNDGTGEYGEFRTKEIFRLLINSNGLYSLSCLGFETSRLKWEQRLPQRKAESFIKIVSVEDNNRKDDTFCFTEPKRNMGMFGGILTGNCTEITLHSDNDTTYTCVLSSLNLSKYDEWKDTDTVFVATVFLDCVAEEFIQQGKEIRGLEKAVRFTEKSRALGLGTLGFHTYLQQNGIAIEDFQALLVNDAIFKNIKEEAMRASKWMAEQWGEPEWCKGYGVRNTHLLAIAPNTTSALICGSVSQGIEPIYKNCYNQGTAAGEMARINPTLLQLLKEKGKYNKATIDDIIDKEGSVQHLDYLSDREKVVFRTSFEVDQKALIRLAADRQKYICQAQSLNLFFSSDEEEKYIAEVHKEAFLNPMIKSLYYMRSEAGVQSSKECVACE